MSGKLEPRTPEPSSPEPRTPEPRTPEPRTLEPRTPDPRTPELIYRTKGPVDGVLVCEASFVPYTGSGVRNVYETSFWLFRLADVCCT